VSTIDLDAIRERVARQVFVLSAAAPLLPEFTVDAIVVLAQDRRVLLAEVDRLTAELAALDPAGDGR
jgi:hypothetical protein